ncbi:hypothetical protein BDV06DRAFT_211046 [Aspergillus oleicola]
MSDVLDPVRIVEVSPRDGLQNIPHQIPTSTKLELIHRLTRTGLTTIELTSIVSPRAVPQLADCREILGHKSIRELNRGSSRGCRTGDDGTDSGELSLPVLIPNLKGLHIAISHNVRSISVFISATDRFSLSNTNCTVSEGLARAREVTIRARKMGINVRGYISCIFTDPFSNAPTDHASVLRCTRDLLDAGVSEIALSDTTGTGTPSQVHSLITYLTSPPHNIPLENLAVHLHDSYGRGLKNVWAAYEAGIRVFDASVAGLGGCPFAPGAKGNVATEEVVSLFESRGVRTGVDIHELEKVGNWVEGGANRSGASPCAKGQVQSRPLAKAKAKATASIGVHNQCYRASMKIKGEKQR